MIHDDVAIVKLENVSHVHRPVATSFSVDKVEYRGLIAESKSPNGLLEMVALLLESSVCSSESLDLISSSLEVAVESLVLLVIELEHAGSDGVHLDGVVLVVVVLSHCCSPRQIGK